METSWTIGYYMKRPADRDRHTRFRVGLKCFCLQSSMLSWANLFELNKSVIYLRTTSNHSVRSEPSDKTALCLRQKSFRSLGKTCRNIKNCEHLYKGAWDQVVFYAYFVLKCFCFQNSVKDTILSKRNLLMSFHVSKSLSSDSSKARSHGCPSPAPGGQRPAEFSSNLLKHSSLKVSRRDPEDLISWFRCV